MASGSSEIFTMAANRLSLLATSAAPSSSGVTGYHWVPFHTPMPIWNAWFWTLLPLAAGIAVVYKTTKTPEIRRIPRESLQLTAWIVLGLIAAAVAIELVVRFA